MAMNRNGAGLGAGLAAAAAVWILGQVTVGRLLTAHVGKVEEALAARPGLAPTEPIAVPSDICSMLTKTGFLHGVALVLFPEASMAADALRRRYRFEPVGRCHRGQGNAVVGRPLP